MKRSTWWTAALLMVLTIPVAAQKEFTAKTIATGLEIPWEIEWGPDGTLWTTERIGVMSRIDPETGVKKVILDRRDIVYLEQETGMLGFTWHPDFPDSPYVYVAYVGGKKSHYWRVVERYTYTSDTLVSPVRIMTFDPAMSYHQGCRVQFGPDKKLYVTMGDSPGPGGSVIDSTLNGKVLRMNSDGSVPDDNPVPGELMYTKGHRNVQGFDILPNGKMWTSEHGNIIEDEVNMLHAGGNYGWPFVEGYCDDEEFERPYCDSANVIEPKWTSGTSTTVAPCGLRHYHHDAYPTLQNSILLTTLKNGTLFQLTLNDSGTAVVSTREHLIRSLGRLRDVAISPDGRVFLCTSNREPNGYTPFPAADDDKIVELIPVPDTATPAFSAPDTVYTKARPGDMFFFTLPVSNTGTASYTVTNVWDIEGDACIHNSQWRVPVVVLPQQTYGMECVFEPTEEGTFTRLVRVVTNELGMHDVVLHGSTTVGLLTPAADTLMDGCVVGQESEVIVPFINTGTDTLTVTGAELSGYDAERFEIITVETGVIEPDGVVNVRLKFSPENPGAHICRVNILSTSYRPAVGYVVCTSTTSVNEPQAPYPFRVHPNPTSDRVTIVLPQELTQGSVAIYDVMGTLVWTASVHGQSTLTWNGTTSTGAMASAGTYIITVSGVRGTSMTILHVTE